MEVIKPFLGSYMESPLFLNNGKYGWYLNHNNKLYGVPKCFEEIVPPQELSNIIEAFKREWATFFQKIGRSQKIAKKLLNLPKKS